jgi:hypothetical protein
MPRQNASDIDRILALRSCRDFERAAESFLAGKPMTA